MYDFYTNAPPWEHNKVPTTSKGAKPRAWATFNNVRAVKVEGAQYRSAILSGVFLIDKCEASFPTSGWYRLKVYCRWFDHRLPTGVPINLKVDGSRLTYMPDYSGEVVTNISR